MSISSIAGTTPQPYIPATQKSTGGEERTESAAERGRETQGGQGPNGQKTGSTGINTEA